MAKSSVKLSCTVAGLVFYPRNLTAHHYIGVAAWVAAGHPDNAYVFDQLSTLHACSIPVCDAIVVNGVYVRTTVRKPKPAKITLVPTVIRSLKQTAIKFRNPGIVATEPNTSKFSY